MKKERTAEWWRFCPRFPVQKSNERCYLWSPMSPGSTSSERCTARPAAAGPECSSSSSSSAKQQWCHWLCNCVILWYAANTNSVLYTPHMCKWTGVKHSTTCMAESSDRLLTTNMCFTHFKKALVPDVLWQNKARGSLGICLVIRYLWISVQCNAPLSSLLISA